jgi:hypothetical protein
MFLLKQILPAAIIAMMVAAGVCGFAFWGKGRAQRVLIPLAVGLGYIAGHLFITGRFSFPPADTTNWLPFFALAGAVIGAVFATVRMPSWARLLLFVAVCAGALRLLLKPKFQYGWSLGQGWIWVMALALGIVLLAIILDALAGRPAPAVALPFFLLLVCGATFGALMLSGSMLLGQFATVLAAAIFGTLLLTLRKVPLGPAIAPIVSLLLGALLISGYFFAELPAASAVLLGVAPALALIPISGAGTMRPFLIRTALMSLPVIGALVLAFRASPPLDY